MKCQECVAEGERSTVHSRGSSTTCMGYDSYFDEDGDWHRHDPNWTTTGWVCSRGHQWTERSLPKCPTCDRATL